MKRFVLLVISLSVIIACATTSDAPAQDADDVVESWVASLTGKDLDALMSTYWSDAVVENLSSGGDGERQTMNGVEEIREMQRGTTDNPDIQLTILPDEVRREMKGESAVYTIEVEAGEYRSINTLTLVKRGDEWRIVHQAIEL